MSKQKSPSESPEEASPEPSAEIDPTASRQQQTEDRRQRQKDLAERVINPIAPSLRESIIREDLYYIGITLISRDGLSRTVPLFPALPDAATADPTELMEAQSARAVAVMLAALQFGRDARFYRDKTAQNLEEPEQSPLPTRQR